MFLSIFFKSSDFRPKKTETKINPERDLFEVNENDDEVSQKN